MFLLDLKWLLCFPKWRFEVDLVLRKELFKFCVFLLPRFKNEVLQGLYLFSFFEASKDLIWFSRVWILWVRFWIISSFSSIVDLNWMIESLSFSVL
jgi:hypothetical protein